MSKSKRTAAVLYALAAAAFYAMSAPFSKRLLINIPTTYMAAFLYLGAGTGVGIMYAFRRKNEPPAERLSRKELPYTVGMIVLDIIAPILMMLGLKVGSAANASLLGNFEIVATALISLLAFSEKISSCLWAAIALITASSAILSFEGAESLHFSPGSLLVLLAACCWGLENNCTRSISDKSTFEIVTLKGLGSGAGAFAIAAAVGEKLPALRYILPAMLLGFVAYGLSIFTYVRAQRWLGAAKTGAYYAFAPFIGVLLSVLVNGEQPSSTFGLALAVMLVGVALAVWDTLRASNETAQHNV